MSLRLFNLIKSLSKSEKRYFKLSASFHKGNKSPIKLFDAIDKQEVYDEAQIKNKFSKEVFIKQLAVANNQLYYQILRSLKSFHANKNMESRIREMLDSAGILLHKGLNEDAISLLNKAKSLALQRENYILVLEINKMSRIRLNDPLNVRMLTEEDDNSLERINRTYEYIRIHTDIIKIHNKGITERGKVEDAGCAAILQGILMKNELLAVSREEKYHYYAIQVLSAFIQSDWENGRVYCVKIIMLVESNPEFHSEFHWQLRYANTLSNYLGICSELLLAEEAKVAIYKLFNIPIVSTPILTLAVSNLLNLYLGTGDFESALLFLKENKTLLPQLENHSLNIFLPLYYINMVALYFAVGDFKKSLQYIHKITHDISLKEYEEINCMAQIINLIVLYELGETDSLEYSIRSTYRFLYKREKKYKFEEAILLFIRKDLPYRKNKKDMKEAFKKIAASRELSINSNKNRALDYFDHISFWLESKIENRPFMDIMKEKLNNSLM